MVDLSTEFAGIRLRNPILAASAGITGRVELMKRAQECGIGGIVMKSVGERQWASPRFRILPTGRGRFKASTLYSVEGSSPFEIERYAQEVAQAKKELEVPVIGSINTTKGDDYWVSCAKAIEEAGADGLELDITCPHGVYMLSGEDVLGEMPRVARVVKGAVSIPVFVKLTPQATNPTAVALRLQGAGVDGVTMFNRFTGLEIDIEEERAISHGGYAGHGGSWAIHYTLRWISETYPRLRIPISASGGVASWEDVVKLLLVGATTVQTATAVIQEGYGVISKLVSGLERHMERKGYSSVGEFRGKAAKRILSVAEVDRQARFLAIIDAERCNACGLCQRICIYDAIEPVDGSYRIMESCVGCGLCVALCPVKGTISLKRV